MIDETWHRKVQQAIVATMALVITICTIGYDSITHYAEDSREQYRYCRADDKAKERQREEYCQSLLYRTVSDPAGFFAFGLLIATVALTVATYRLYRTAVRQGADAKKAIVFARQSAEAAETYARIARDSLIATNRAWLKASAELADGELFFDLQGGFGLPLNVVIKNIGKEPAINASICAWMKVRWGMDFDPIEVAIIAQCEENRQTANGQSISIFPNETFPPEGSTGRIFGLGIEKGDFEDAISTTVNHPRLPDGSYLWPFVYGCVSYRTPSDGATVHQTRFLYKLWRKDDLPVSAWQSVPTSELKLTDGSYDLSPVAD